MKERSPAGGKGHFGTLFPCWEKVESQEETAEDKGGEESRGTIT